MFQRFSQLIPSLLFLVSISDARLGSVKMKLFRRDEIMNFDEKLSDESVLERPNENSNEANSVEENDFKPKKPYRTEFIDFPLEVAS